ncbi:MAG: alpha/beta fold hydrolase [Alteromonadaceae bacterium]|nr:alpha/beta fold hydrolase [Alteromonadaceae bacterium]
MKANVLIVLLSLVSLSAHTEELSFEAINLRACEVWLDGDQRYYSAQCGEIRVPEVRSDPNTRMLTLPITLISALHPQFEQSPIIWLDGGPGSINSMTYPSDDLMQQHDWIIVGYRGMEGDNQLHCSSIRRGLKSVASAPLAAEHLKQLTQSARNCAHEIEQQGMDLRGYTISETVADIDQVRQQLGVKQIKLFANSYGTRLALEYLWRYPQHVERALLVSVNPPGHFRWRQSALAQLLDKYSDICQQQKQCCRSGLSFTKQIQIVQNRAPTSWFGLPIRLDLLRLVTAIALTESQPVNGAIMPLNGPAILDLWCEGFKGNYASMAAVSVLAPHALAEIFHWEHFMALGSSAPDYHQPSTITMISL